MLDTHMRRLSKELEADPPMEAILPGIYEYWLADDVCITIKAMQPQGYALSATFGFYPKEKEEVFFESMLVGNLFGKETFGATLGLDEDGRRMVLSKVVELRVDYSEFKAILEDFVHIINFWRQEAGLAPV